MLYATQCSKDPHGRSEPPLQRNAVYLLFSFSETLCIYYSLLRFAPSCRVLSAVAEGGPGRCAHRAPPHAAEPSSCAATSARAARGPTRRASTSASRGASLASSETWRRCDGAPGLCAGQTLVKRSRARSQPGSNAGQTHAAPPRAGVLTGATARQGVYSVDFHPSLSKVAIGSGDGTVRWGSRTIFLPFSGPPRDRGARLLPTVWSPAACAADAARAAFSFEMQLAVLR
jgi:hypothetical protein